MGVELAVYWIFYSNEQFTKTMFVDSVLPTILSTIWVMTLLVQVREIQLELA